MCLVEDKRLAVSLEAIPVTDIHIAITTHARRKFIKRFPAPQAPTDLDENFRGQVRQSFFLCYSKERGKAIYGNKNWEFVVALNRLRDGELEVVVISCWREGESDFDSRYWKSRIYRRTREKRQWRQEECLI